MKIDTETAFFFHLDKFKTRQKESVDLLKDNIRGLNPMREKKKVYRLKCFKDSKFSHYIEETDSITETELKKRLEELCTLGFNVRYEEVIEKINPPK